MIVGGEKSRRLLGFEPNPPIRERTMANNRNKRRRAHDKRTLARTVMAHAKPLGLDARALKREPVEDLSVHLISSVYRGGDTWRHAKGQFMGYTRDDTNDDIFVDMVIKAVARA